MKPWLLFAVLTIVCWGAYVPTLHNGQKALGHDSALRAFLFVGLAYFVVSAGVLLYLFVGDDPMIFTAKGVTLSTFAGILGAVGALGIVFAFKFNGSPLIVAPLVFAGAPIINTIVSMIWSKPATSPHPMFFVGILVAAFGAAMVLRYKPAPAKHTPAAPTTEQVQSAATPDSTRPA